MSVQTAAGASLSIATGKPATEDPAGYAALSFDIIGEVTEIPEFGDSFDEVTHEPLNKRRPVTLKGLKRGGALSVPLGRDLDDAGQAAAKAARDEDADYSFKVTLQDGSSTYFYGQVFSFTLNPGSANSIVGSTLNISVNSDQIEVAA